MDHVLGRATALARELADPVRLAALQVLATEGPHTMSQLAEALRVTAPRLGNHLARLRAAGLISVEHTGRHAVYQVAGAGLGDVLAALVRYAGPDGAGWTRGEPADLARSCYDHAAGQLGVRLFATLVERGALHAPDGSTAELTLGPDPVVLADLGIDPTTLDPGRRKLATACLDRTYRLPHLGGQLGRAVLDTFVHNGLVERAPGSRVLTVTPAGAQQLPTLLPGFHA
jgi:DNA-binding transcriptional ArsR family regulator